jgi:hypothetical protein
MNFMLSWNHVSADIVSVRAGFVVISWKTLNMNYEESAIKQMDTHILVEGNSWHQILSIKQTEFGPYLACLQEKNVHYLISLWWKPFIFWLLTCSNFLFIYCPLE